MKTLLLLGLVLAIGASGYAYQDPKPSSDSKPSGESSEPALKALPPITLQDLEGQAVKTDGLKGKVVVLDFWATWCLPCLSEIPVLNGLQEKYGSRGLEVIGVTLASGEPKEVKPFIAKNGMKYTILMGNDEQTYDFDIVGFPTTFLLTKDLKVYRKYIGTGPKKGSQLETDIQRLLGN